jgi:cytoskeletal protein CcmA (bactofilin family)
MATLTGNRIQNTYYKLLQVDNGQIVQNGLGSPVTGSINLSGSLHVTGSSTFGGDLRVHGNITAQQFIATTVSSSVVYESGSSQFGNSLDDNHDFTGSLNLTGSLLATGSLEISGSITSQNTITADRGLYAGMFLNPNTIEENVTVPSNHNARLFGPTVTIGTGYTFTVEAASTLTIL